ncbi:uncharacterized protein LOC116351329 [Contarinia nasturtii]|uniref:uncharacterized protein LOC116349990 n=1 Tax=Contarinia nasturtii TaxID=265458 RepID=UPI0012D3C5F7|nr:uncharacterized protein LOC116349990 [Contarinia nasturtii]XP_031639279.1 uncharacterized protein LOC116351329 [Contarinia nasturtii]
MSSILNIASLPMRDDSIIRKEIYQYTPYTNSFDESDEIRIAIQNKESYLAPSQSFIYLQIACTTNGRHVDGDAEIKFVNNFASFLFSDVRYELNGVEIDSVRNVGRASTMKLMLASRLSTLNGYASFCRTYEATSPRADVEKLYDVVIPLSAWLPFCDTYNRCIINCRHELILNRARQSLDCTHGGGILPTSAVVSVAVKKIEWKMPHITLSDKVKLNMLSYLSKNRKITVQHRSMDIHEYQLPQTTNHLWSVKTVASSNKPRYVVVGLQTNRNAQKSVNASKFDACHLTDVRLHLNSQIYPYNMNTLDIGGGIYSELYALYSDVQTSYYNNTEAKNPFDLPYGVFQSSPIFAFDTSHADESLVGGSIDVRIELKAKQNIPANTTAYCLIIYDNEFWYSPFDGIVMRNV